MTNSKATKRALVTSALAILACVAMLIGTTFAWFTDTASTGVNKIQAGNLDIELSYKNNSTDGEFKTASKETSVFNAGALWEPGHVEYVVLKIRNAGTLALKYKLGINIAEEVGSINVDGNPFNLSDYIRFAVLDDDMSTVGRDALVTAAEKDSKLIKEGYATEEHMAADAEAKVVTLVVWMPTTVGNEANHKTGETAPFIKFGISVAATQDTVEKDSFDEQYDKNAQYPEVAYAQASTQEELNAALANPTDANGNPTSKIAVDLKKGSYTLPELTGKDVAFVGTKDTVIDIKGTINKASSISFEGVTVAFSDENYKGFQHTGKLTYKDCTITGLQVLYATDVEFVNCTFKQDTFDKYNAQVYGSTNVTFTDCHFYGTNKNVYIYQETLNSDKNVTFTNCDFHMSATEDLKSAVMLNAPMDYAGYKYHVVINSCTAEGANTTAAEDVAGNTNYQGLYGLKHKDGNNNPKIVEGTVTVNGVIEYSK